MPDISSKNKSADDNEDEEGQDEDEFDFDFMACLINSGNYFDLFYFWILFILISWFCYLFLFIVCSVYSWFFVATALKKGHANRNLPSNGIIYVLIVNVRSDLLNI